MKDYSGSESHPTDNRLISCSLQWIHCISTFLKKEDILRACFVMSMKEIKMHGMAISILVKYFLEENIYCFGNG